jgi:hypothetical protein
MLNEVMILDLSIFELGVIRLDSKEDNMDLV